MIVAIVNDEHVDDLKKSLGISILVESVALNEIIELITRIKGFELIVPKILRRPFLRIGKTVVFTGSFQNVWYRAYALTKELQKKSKELPGLLIIGEPSKRDDKFVERGLAAEWTDVEIVTDISVKNIRAAIKRLRR